MTEKGALHARLYMQVTQKKMNDIVITCKEMVSTDTDQEEHGCDASLTPYC